MSESVKLCDTSFLRRPYWTYAYRERIIEVLFGRVSNFCNEAKFCDFHLVMPTREMASVPHTPYDNTMW